MEIFIHTGKISGGMITYAGEMNGNEWGIIIYGKHFIGKRFLNNAMIAFKYDMQQAE